MAPAAGQFCIVQLSMMRYTRDISAVLSGQFLLEESAMQAFRLRMVQQLLSHQSAEQPQQPEGESLPVFQAISFDASSVQLNGYRSLDDVPVGSIAVTVVAGVMLPEDDWWNDTLGTVTLGNRIQQADAHPNIVAQVIVWRTPGGSVLGLESFASIVKNCLKPTVSFGEQMCSAGYWVGSSADRVVVGGKTGMLGSIGTKFDFIDFSGYYAKLGIKEHSVRATDSTDKNAAFDEAAAGKYDLIRSELLDPLNNVFLDSVRENMDLTAAQEKLVLTGKVFIGQACVDNGLAHQLGTLQDAIQLAFDLAAEASATGAAGGNSTASSFSLSTTTNQSMGLFTKTATLGAVMALAGKTTISAAEHEAANAELAAAGVTDAAIITKAEYLDLTAKAGRTATAEAKVTELTATVGTLTTAKTTAETALTASQAEVMRLGALAGAAPTTAGKAEGDQLDAPKAHAWFDATAQHNKDAEALLG